MRPGPAGEPPDGSHPHVLVDGLDAVDGIGLDDDAAHHLGRVRRLRDGDPCTATDGAGSWRPCRYRADGRLEPDGEIVTLERPDPPITVAFALTKGVKPDWTVQKLTEVGVDHIVVFRAERSVVRWDEAKAGANLARLRTIARGAVEQSRRCWVPSIGPVVDTTALAAQGAVRVDRGGPPPTLAQNVLAVGPEGGWADTEREILSQSVGLGPHVLRAETAALTSGVMLLALRSGIVRERPENVDGA